MKPWIWKWIRKLKMTVMNSEQFLRETFKLCSASHHSHSLKMEMKVSPLTASAGAAQPFFWLFLQQEHEWSLHAGEPAGFLHLLSQRTASQSKPAELQHGGNEEANLWNSSGWVGCRGKHLPSKEHCLCKQDPAVSFLIYPGESGRKILNMTCWSHSAFYR